MPTRYFALILGIFYTLVGLMGFIPGLLQAPTAGNPPVTFNFLHGDLLGIFPVNILHTLIHLVVGIWGLMAYRSFSASRSYAISVGIVFAFFFLMGLIPGLQTTFGLIPLHGADVWLHLATAALGLFFGLAAPRESLVDTEV